MYCNMETVKNVPRAPSVVRDFCIQRSSLEPSISIVQSCIATWRLPYGKRIFLIYFHFQREFLLPSLRFCSSISYNCILIQRTAFVIVPYWQLGDIIAQSFKSFQDFEPDVPRRSSRSFQCQPLPPLPHWQEAHSRGQFHPNRNPQILHFYPRYLSTYKA